MNGFMSERMVKFYKDNYPPGTRVQLDSMGDDPRPIPAGTKGTVQFVDDIGTIFVNFDNGRQLGMCPDVDRFHKIKEQEEAPAQDPHLSM